MDAPNGYKYIIFNKPNCSNGLSIENREVAGGRLQLKPDSKNFVHEMDFLLHENSGFGVVGLESLDNILEGILDNDNSSSDDFSAEHRNEISHSSSPSASPSSENGQNGLLQCIVVKTEIPDSSVRNLMYFRILSKFRICLIFIKDLEITNGYSMYHLKDW